LLSNEESSGNLKLCC